MCAVPTAPGAARVWLWAIMSRGWGPRRGDRYPRVTVLYAPAPTGDLLPGFYRRTASNVLQPEPRSTAATARFLCAVL